MNWLEIIELRTVNSAHYKLESKIRSVIEDFQNSATDHIIKVFYRYGLENDLSIHIQHHSNKVEINGSVLGVQWVEILKQFGLTNHSIWIEKTGDKK